MPYMIDDVILFDEIKGSLRNMCTGDEIAIPPAAAGILLTLFVNKTRTVERDEVINQVFLLLGFDLSTNTLTQYISLLRKNLKKIGIENDVILTVPKIGFYISEERNIIQIDDEVSTTEKATPSFKVTAEGSNKFYLIITFFFFIISIEVISITQSRGVEIEEYNLVKSGEIDGCSMYTPYNLKQVKRHEFDNVATELAHRFLPCTTGSFYIFDINAMSLINKKGKLYLARCTGSNDSLKPVVCSEVAIRE